LTFPLPGIFALGLALAPATQEHSLVDDLGRYIERLGAVRANDDAAAAELLELARHMCEAHARCDTVDVARFYAGLPAEARTVGLAQEAEYESLRAELLDAGRDGVVGEAWRELREELLEDLDTLATRAASEPDVTPAARARALQARIELKRIVSSRQPRELTETWIAEAEAHARESIELFKRTGMLTPRLEPLWVLASLERARHDVDAALANFERCLELAVRVGRDEYRSLALLGLVGLARDRGDVAQVDRLLAEIASFEDPASNWLLAREHAARLLHKDRAEVALAFLTQRAPRNAANEIEWRALAGMAFLRSGDLASARRELEALGGSGELAVLSRATLALEDNQAQEALDALTTVRAGEDFEGWTFRSRVTLHALVGEARLTLGDAAGAVLDLGVALERAEAWRALQGTESGDSGSVIGEWVGLHSVVLLAEAHAELGNGLEAARVIEDLQSARLRSPTGAADAPGNERASLTDDNLKSWAARFDRGLVTWGIGADSCVVAHVSAAGESWASSIPYGRRSFEDAVRRLREAAILGDEERTGQLADEIGRVLFPTALRDRLRASGAHEPRALFLLHGPLEALPLSLIELDGELLDDIFDLCVLPGLPAHEPGPALRTEELTDWMLLGSPLGLREGEESEELLLPGASRELAALARLYPDARLHTGAAFVSGAMTAAVRGGGPLHVATHLIVTDVCADGRLAPIGLELSGGEVYCASEVLQQAAASPLVVLTACETAGGRFIDAEGLHGVGRAFLESGTRNLVATLWPVEDEAARIFAVAFHRQLKKGDRPSQAARYGRRILRDAGRSAADWAAFRFLGRD